MNTFYDYIYWRGSLNFSQLPFNEIDGMIFSILSYVNYSSVFPFFDVEKEFSLYDVVEDFEKNDVFNNIKELSDFDKECLFLLRKLSSFCRFSKVKIKGYQEVFNSEKEIQFGAISFILSDKTNVISFRGTDTSLIGWKEDFAMSFSTSVGSQEKGAEYLINMTKNNEDKVIVVGHSKGGNVAVYSSVKAPESLMERIIKVYNFDGPGFNKKAIDSGGFEKLGIEKITTLVPQSSMVGILLEHEEPFNVVYSSKKTGIFQHYPMSWEVEPGRFRRLEETNNSSQYFDKTIRAFLEEMDDKELSLFVDTLFNTFQAGGAITLKDLFKNPAKNISAMHHFYTQTPSETRKLIDEIVKAFFKISRNVYKREEKSSLFIDRYLKNKITFLPINNDECK